MCLQLYIWSGSFVIVTLVFCFPCHQFLAALPLFSTHSYFSFCKARTPTRIHAWLVQLVHWQIKRTLPCEPPWQEIPCGSEATWVAPFRAFSSSCKVRTIKRVSQKSDICSLRDSQDGRSIVLLEGFQCWDYLYKFKCRSKAIQTSTVVMRDSAGGSHWIQANKRTILCEINLKIQLYRWKF